MPADVHRPDLSPDGRLLAWAGGRRDDIYFLPGVGEPEFKTGAPGRWTTGLRLWITDTVEGSTWPY